MTRRSLLVWIVVFVNLLIISAALWRRTHIHKEPFRLYPAQLALWGLKPGITPAENRDATNIFVHERLMWSKFDGVSARIRLELEDNDAEQSSFAANMSLQRIDLPSHESSPTIAKYQLTISDEGWSVTTDGTAGAATTMGADRVPKTLRTVDPASVLYMLTFPQYLFASLYRDDLYPDAVNPYTLQQLLNIWVPWRLTNSSPHSYCFWDWSCKHPEFRFQNGHFQEWRKTAWVTNSGVAEELALYFENPVRSAEFWYPSVIRITPAPTPWPYPNISKGWLFPIVHPATAACKGSLTIKLSGITVKTRR